MEKPDNRPYFLTQKYSECAILAIMNAAIHYRIRTRKEIEAQYEELVDLCDARHGAALAKAPAFEAMGIRNAGKIALRDPRGRAALTSVTPQIEWDFEQILGQGFTIAAPIWDLTVGYHTVLLVNLRQKAGEGMYIHCINGPPKVDQWVPLPELLKLLDTSGTYYGQIHKGESEVVWGWVLRPKGTRAEVLEMIRNVEHQEGTE